MTNREALWMSLNEIGRLVETGKYTGATIQTMQAIKEALSSCQCSECKVAIHASDCAVHSEPAYPKSECNCGAQPSVSVEQEPRCEAIIEVFGKDWRLDYMSLPVGKHKLYTQQYTYTTPPQRKPLSDEEIILIVADCASSHQHTDIHFARAIEAAHGIYAPTERKGEA